jgi:hypothetical protein
MNLICPVLLPTPIIIIIIIIIITTTTTTTTTTIIYIRKCNVILDILSRAFWNSTHFMTNTVV